MLTRLSTAFIVLLGLSALVNAGTVPAARAVGELEKRNNVARAANYVVLAREETPEPDPDD